MVAAVGVLVIAFCSRMKSSSQTVDKPWVKDAEEYSVYGAVLDSQFAPAKSGRIVINSSTISRAKPAFFGLVCGLTPAGAKRPNVESDTATDFDAKNAKTYLLKSQFDSKAPYVLVPDQQLRALFAEPSPAHIDLNSWKLFYQRYPGAPGVIAFSSVGLNAKKSQALVYVANQRGCLSGSGSFVVLSKDNSWKIQKIVVVWIS